MNSMCRRMFGRQRSAATICRSWLTRAPAVHHSPSGHGHSHGDDPERAPPRPEDWCVFFLDPPPPPLCMYARPSHTSRHNPWAKCTGDLTTVHPNPAVSRAALSRTDCTVHIYIFSILYFSLLQHAASTCRWDVRNQVAEDAADVMFIVVLASGTVVPSARHSPVR